MSVQKLIVTKDTSNFTVLPNKVLQGLTDAFALGVWVYLASLPPNWEVYRNQIRDHFGVGVDKMNKAFTTLKKCELIEILPIKNSHGQFETWNLHVDSGENFKSLPPKIDQKDNKNQNIENPDSGRARECQPAPIKENKKRYIKDNLDQERAAATRRTPKTNFPLNFSPTQKQKQYSENSNLSLEDEVERFSDHYKAHGIKQADWECAFNLWLRGSMERKERKPKEGDAFSRAMAKIRSKGRTYDEQGSDIDIFRSH